ncbi:MAG TPA: agmatinase [Nitrososphaerales archaeon]|nr:agmatinase [Nitrososphaerales archaeon]
MRQVDARDSPRFAQISTFGRLPFIQDLTGVKAAFIGVPFDDGTTYRTGPRFGPSSIRQGSRLLRRYNPFVDSEPFETLNVCDFGDVNTIPGYIEDTMKIIETDFVRMASKCVPFAAGGDHSIALPILRAMHKVHGKVNLLHLDSHYDFWDSYWGKKYNHGTWLRRAKEEGLLNEVIQVGIRASLYSKEDIEDSKKLGITYYTTNATKINPGEILRQANSLKGKTYLSLDIDVVDPAFAPGTGTPEVGGLSSFEVMDFIRKLRLEQLVGMEVVEVSPPYDVSELTSMLAANLLYEGMSVLAKK